MIVKSKFSSLTSSPFVKRVVHLNIQQICKQNLVKNQRSTLSKQATHTTETEFSHPIYPKKKTWRKTRLIFYLIMVGGTVVLGHWMYKKTSFFIDEKRRRKNRNHLVVLGTGWASLALLDNIDTTKYEGFFSICS